MSVNKTKVNVKKTFVRNCEQKVKPSQRKPVVYDVESSTKASVSSQGVLEHPTLCSSEALANCLSEIKLKAPPSSVVADIYAESSNMGAKITKKLNFHFNDQIYKNLIELNCTTEELKKSKLRKPIVSTKKDLEPNIEDFSEEIQDEDHPPSIPVIKPKFKLVKKVENGHLHRLIAKYENL